MKIAVNTALCSRAPRRAQYNFTCLKGDVLLVPGGEGGKGEREGRRGGWEGGEGRNGR